MRKAASSQTGRPSRDYRCEHCDSLIDDSGRILFVEEEVGRTFCSEDCIVSFFGPDIQRLEKHYLRHLKASDLTTEDRERLAHLRWTTLEKPDEVWAEKTVAGDNRYTLIRSFRVEGQQVWCVCVSLFLRGEPSFLYLAFVSRDESLVDAFRCGEKVSWTRGSAGSKAVPRGGDAQAADAEAGAEPAGGRAGEPELKLVSSSEGTDVTQSSDSDGRSETASAGEGEERPLLDCLAEPFTQDELIRAELYRARSTSDIPRTDFDKYERCLDPTLEKPDEVWSIQLNRKGRRLFNFLRRFAGTATENPSGSDIWYIMIAKETADPEQIEILDAFPTNDPKLAENYRKGTRDYSSAEATPEGEQAEAPKVRKIVH